MGGQIAESFFQVSAEEVDKDSEACVWEKEKVLFSDQAVAVWWSNLLVRAWLPVAVLWPRCMEYTASVRGVAMQLQFQMKNWSCLYSQIFPPVFFMCRCHLLFDQLDKAIEKISYPKVFLYLQNDSNHNWSVRFSVYTCVPAIAVRYRLVWAQMIFIFKIMKVIIQSFVANEGKEFFPLTWSVRAFKSISYVWHFGSFGWLWYSWLVSHFICCLFSMNQRIWWCWFCRRSLYNLFRCVSYSLFDFKQEITLWWYFKCLFPTN